MRAVVVVSLLVAVGCGGKERNATSSENKTDSASSPEQFVSQLCEEFASCCTAAGLPGDGTQCRAFFGAFAAGRDFDQTKANACLRDARALGDDKCDSMAGVPSCNEVFASVGTAKPGEPCQDDTDCASSAKGAVRCAEASGSDASVRQCQLQLPGVKGSAPCVGTVQGSLTYSLGSSDTTVPATGYLCDVADGLSCDEQSGACVALGQVGQACTPGVFPACLSSTYCDFTDEVCKDRQALGSPCRADDWCLANAYCEPSEHTCTARRAEGESCTTDAECLSDNCTNQQCGKARNFALALLCGTN